MPSVPFFKFCFTPSWLIVFLTMLFFLLFVRLGFWQIQRAEEKNQIIAIQKKRENLKHIEWKPTEKLPLQYERIKLKGTYLSQNFGRRVRPQ